MIVNGVRRPSSNAVCGRMRGTSRDNRAEAGEFCQLYSWELTSDAPSPVGEVRRRTELAYGAGATNDKDRLALIFSSAALFPGWEKSYTTTGALLFVQTDRCSCEAKR